MVLEAIEDINGQSRPRLVPEYLLLNCLMQHGCRTDSVSSEMLTGIHRKIFEAIRDLESQGGFVSAQGIGELLVSRPGGDYQYIEDVLNRILREYPNPGMFDLYEREIIERAEREGLESHFAEGLQLCRSKASVSELREHAGSVASSLTQPAETIQFVNGAELAGMDTRITFAVEDVIVQSQPLLLVGPKKTLKTNISIDLALSLATGRHFLGEYEVPRPMRVGLMSAESGAATIKETAHRIAIAKGFNGVQDCPDALFAFETPMISTAKECDRFRRIIEDNRLEFLNIDPSYLTFAIGDDGKNIFRMGELLAPLSRIGQQTGCTICLSHHSRKGTGKDGKALELGDESYSGFSEWARQWILLSRREPYDENYTGSHRLWMRWGGSTGHSGLIGIDVEEGSRKDQWGRIWDLRLVDPDGVVQERLTANEERQQAQRDATFQKHLDAAEDALRSFPIGETASNISLKAKLSNTKCKEALFELQEQGIAEPCVILKNNRTYEGWKLINPDSRTSQVSESDSPAH